MISGRLIPRERVVCLILLSYPIDSSEPVDFHWLLESFRPSGLARPKEARLRWSSVIGRAGVEPPTSWSRSTDPAELFFGDA